jgi:archaeal chaperonin
MASIQTTAGGGMPVLILREGTKESKGKEAQTNNIIAAKLVAETVKTCLGPRGMDKMLVNTIGDTTITNDGATILKEMDIEHPAAKMMVEVAILLFISYLAICFSIIIPKPFTVNYSS